MSLVRQPKRFQTFFPTVAEGKSGVPFISDHAPLLIDQAIGSEKLRLMTFNVHAIGSWDSGLLAEEKKDEDIIERGMKTIIFLIKMIEEQNVDIIFTQETYFLSPGFKKNPIMKDAIEKLEKERGWRYCEGNNGIPPKDLLVMYNANRFKLIPPAKEEKKVETEVALSPVAYNWLRECTQKLTFEIIGKGLTVNFAHVHWAHSYVPDDAEAILQSLKNTMVVGDFNCRFVIPNKKYLVNNIVSPNFRENKQQGVDYVDGAFVVDEKGEPHQCSDISVVDFTTGKIHPDVVPDLKTFTQDQIIELKKQSLFMTIVI